MALSNLSLAHLVPPGAGRLVRIGPFPAVWETACHTGCEVIRLSQNMTSELDRTDLPEKADAVLCWLEQQDQHCLEKLLSRLTALVASEGRATLVCDNPAQPPWSLPWFDKLLEKTGWLIFQQGSLIFSEPSTRFHAVVIVRQTYNPVEHARALADHGRPDLAISLLSNLPASFLSSSDTLTALLALEKQRLYLRWQTLIQEKTACHALFSKERREFAQTTTLFPTQQESYRIHSNFWSLIGRPDMAVRTLRSIEQVAPDAKTRHLLQVQMQQPHSRMTIDSAAEVTTCRETDTPKPRVLFITHGTSDYGQDMLFHGLRTVLGESNVVDYPWKPTLHGHAGETANNYPCVFSYPDQPLAVDEIVAQLEAHRFDLILFADIIGMQHREQIRHMLNAAPDLPIILYDAWDDCHTPLATILEYLGRSELALIFKREMLDGVDYGPKTFPLPFGYPEPFGSTGLPFEQRSVRPPFWAGRNEFGLRPLYIQRLEQMTGQAMTRRFEQDVYRQQLRTSLIGLSFFGVGFDTVRYWEIPANGVMLLAERPPIRIPNNFTDGVSAVFFDTMQELETKLCYYQKHPERAFEIAMNGRDHYLKHHTTTERARYFLNTVYQQLPIVTSSTPATIASCDPTQRLLP